MTRDAAWNAVAVGVGLAVAAGLWIALDPAFSGSAAADFSRRFLFEPLRVRLADQMFSRSFAAVMAATLFLEALVPARPGQRWFSASAVQDLGWCLYECVLHAVVVSTWVVLLMRGHARYLGGFTVPVFGEWPALARFGAGFFVTDACMWFQHWLHHRVPLLWKLHAVHHSQTELTFFSDFRYHTLEYLVRETVLAVPLILLRVDLPYVIGLSAFHRWYTRFYHANIRTGLGPLRYLLVTPQSHRIHHSLEPRHQDQNFGSFLSLWDALFGTRSRDVTSYPETGIADRSFPLERSLSPLQLLAMPIRQMAWSLAQIAGKRSETPESDAPAAPSPDSGAPDSPPLA